MLCTFQRGHKNQLISTSCTTFRRELFTPLTSNLLTDTHQYSGDPYCSVIVSQDNFGQFCWGGIIIRKLILFAIISGYHFYGLSFIKVVVCEAFWHKLIDNSKTCIFMSLSPNELIHPNFVKISLFCPRFARSMTRQAMTWSSYSRSRTLMEFYCPLHSINAYDIHLLLKSCIIIIAQLNSRREGHCHIIMFVDQHCLHMCWVTYFEMIH